MSDRGTPGSGLGDGVAVASVPEEDAPEHHATPSVAEETANATWTVGTLSPTVVKVLTFFGFAIPVGAYLALLAHYQVNAISGDQWADVGVIARSYGHFPDWSSLWSLHTDNRIFFPNLIVVGLAHTVNFNIEVEEFLSALMLLASVALLIWAHKRRSPGTPLLYYCPVTFVMLTFAQWQNTLWGFQMAWYLVLLALAVALVLLDRPSLAWPVFACAVLAAVVGSYSSLQGLLIWPVGLVLLYHRRRPVWTFVSWLLIGVVTTAWYFHGYKASDAAAPGTTHYALHHPVLDAKFFLFALGDVVGLPVKYGGQIASHVVFGGPSNPAVIVFGAAILVLAVFVVVRWGIRRDEQGGTPVGVALVVFGLLFDAMITEGRVGFGYWGASQSRYVTYDVLVLVGIYLTALGRAPARAPSAEPSTASHQPTASAWAVVDRIDRRTVIWVALAAMVIQVAFGVHYGIAGARSEEQRYLSEAAVTRNIDHEPDLTVFGLYPGESPQTLRDQAAFLRSHHLSLFG